MKTKFHIISGGVTYDVAPTDIRNWDEIEFTLERKDYSGVMRSFSSEFQFVGAAYRLLRDLYLADGFLASAEVSASTKNNDWTYTEQFRCPLDFSTLEIEHEVLTINAIDNTLAGLLKSKKGQKYQFPVSEFDLTQVEITRMAFANSVKYKLPRTSNPSGTVDVRIDETASTIVSTEYVEPYDESTNYDGVAANSFFAKINTAPSPLIRIAFAGYVRFPFSIHNASTPTPAELQLGYWVDDSNPHFQLWYKITDNDVTKKLINGSIRNLWIGKTTHANYATLDALKAAAAARTDIIGLYAGCFGVVGSAQYPNAAYWSDNTVYEYTGSTWMAKGSPNNYYQDRLVSTGASFQNLASYEYPRLQLSQSMTIYNATMNMTWQDVPRDSLTMGGISPVELLERIVSAISDTATATIADDDDGLLAKTYIFPAEALRQFGEAKIFSTFQQFCEWMEAVFGYTYRVSGNEVQFLPRADVFNASSVKTIDKVRDVKYSINDNLIYSEINAGYAKKEYGEINGRLETNFTNYYATDYNATDKKLQLISKYRTDAYGIEFTLRKGEKQSETTDDKNDEDIFVLCAEDENDTLTYKASKNAAYAPAVCVANNADFISALGNGKAVTLKMTSSDGNNPLDDVTIAAGTALFSAGKLEFTTDDMLLPADWDGLISIDHNGYRFRGFISKASARYGRQNGMEYELIIKDITKL
jgi:hypothetical protein